MVAKTCQQTMCADEAVGLVTITIHQIQFEIWACQEHADYVYLFGPENA